MALTVGNKTNDNWATPAGGTSRSISHTHNAGARGYLFVITCHSNQVGQDITGITYNGVALTQIDTRLTSVSTMRWRTWRLANPSSGTNNLVISCEPLYSPLSTEIISFTDCGGEGNIGFTDTQAGPTTVDISITNNSYIIGAGVAGTTGTNVTIDGSSRTIDWNNNVNNWHFGGVSAQLAFGTRTTSVNASASVAVLAVEVKESLGAATNTAIAI